MARTYHLQDCEAYRLRGSEQGWQLVGSMESKGRPGVGDHREESALNMFRQMDMKGKTKDDTQLKTVHQNTISTIRTYDHAGGAVKKFSSMFLSPVQTSICRYSILATNFTQRAVLMEGLSSGIYRKDDKKPSKTSVSVPSANQS